MSHAKSAGQISFLSLLRSELRARNITTTDACIVKKCELILDAPCVCISCDDSSLFAGAAGKRPDFLIAVQASDRERFHWVVVEVKTGNIPGKAADQLQAARDVIASLTPPAPSNARFVPLVLHQRGAKNVGDLIVWSRGKIRYHDGSRPAIARECGARLTEILAAQP